MSDDLQQLTKRPLTVVFFGIQGSGKGTQSRLLQGYLERNADVPNLYLEMGERLRGFATGAGFASKKVGETLNTGSLLPAFIPSHIITSFFLQEFTGREHVIVDGVARRIEQAVVLDEALAFFGREDYQTIVLDLPRDVAVERMKGRGRNDDDDHKIERRLAWYESETLPAIQEIERRGRVVHHISGRPSVEEVHQEILKALSLA